MENTNKKERFGYQQAAAQMDSIKAMITALNCDYGRLEELRERVADEAENLSDFRKAEAVSLALSEEEAEELAALEEAANGCADYDEARQAIDEDALSVEIRSDWVTPGEEMKADNFRIVLCTGGPHVELQGDFDQYGQPDRVYMKYSDWGESGEYHGENFDHDALLAYAQCFYFGE